MCVFPREILMEIANRMDVMTIIRDCIVEKTHPLRHYLSISADALASKLDNLVAQVAGNINKICCPDLIPLLQLWKFLSEILTQKTVFVSNYALPHWVIVRDHNTHETVAGYRAIPRKSKLMNLVQYFNIAVHPEEVVSVMNEYFHPGNVGRYELLTGHLDPFQYDRYSLHLNVKLLNHKC